MFETEVVPVWLQRVLAPLELPLYQDVIPAGEPDGVIYSLQDNRDINFNSAEIAMFQQTWQVKRTIQASWYGAAAPDAEAIHGILQGAGSDEPVVEGHRVTSCIRETTIRYKVAIGAELTYVHLGGAYRILVQ